MRASWDVLYMLLPSPLPPLVLSFVLPLQVTLCSLAPHVTFALFFGWPLLFRTSASWSKALTTYSVHFAAFLISTTSLFLVAGVALWLAGFISGAATASLGFSTVALGLVFVCNLRLCGD